MNYYLMWLYYKNMRRRIYNLESLLLTNNPIKLSITKRGESIKNVFLNHLLSMQIILPWWLNAACCCWLFPMVSLADCWAWCGIRGTFKPASSVAFCAIDLSDGSESMPVWNENRNQHLDTPGTSLTWFNGLMLGTSRFLPIYNKSKICS